MRWFFGHKKDVENAKEEARRGFEAVKKDMNSLTEWIKHLEGHREVHHSDLEDLKKIISSLKEEMKEIREVLHELQQTLWEKPHKEMFKTRINNISKQMSVVPVQTSVSYPVQTMNLSNFSITERAIIGVLLNSDLKLSYDDLATMLGKEKSTIRGQINTIKQKSPELIQEFVEKTGKKRVFITQKQKEKILKKARVRVR